MIAKVLAVIMAAVMTCQGFPSYIDTTRLMLGSSLHVEQFCGPGSPETDGAITLTFSANANQVNNQVYHLEADYALFGNAQIIPPGAGILSGADFTWYPHMSGDQVLILLTNGPCWCGFFQVAQDSVAVFMPFLYSDIHQEAPYPTPTR